MSLSIISSQFIHVVVYDRSYFFLKAEKYLIVFINHILLMHISVDGHSACFHLLTVVNNATMSTGVQISFKILFSVPLDKYPEVGLLDHMPNTYI